MVALVLITPNSKGLPLIWVFPWGLFRLVDLGLEIESIGASLAIAWLPYLVLTVAALAVRRRTIFFVVYGVLCGLLLLNVGGCRLMLAELNTAR